MLYLVQAPPPATPSASPISVTTALITAGALLVGILITNWLQNRRESRTFERQLLLYANQWGDQRDKDIADREDQRRRDHEAWKREDRHRFASEKRVVYVDFLRSMNSFSNNVYLMVGAIEDELLRRSEEGLTNQFDYNQWLHRERPHLIETLRSVDHTIADQVWILSSTDNLGDKARAIKRALLEVQNDLLNTNTIARAEAKIEYVAHGMGEIRSLMRDDLKPGE